MLEMGLLGMVMQAFLTAVLGYMGWVSISPPQQFTVGFVLLAAAVAIALWKKKRRNKSYR